MPNNIFRKFVTDMKTSKNFCRHWLNKITPCCMGLTYEVIKFSDNTTVIIGHFTSADYKKIQGEDATIVSEVKDNNGLVQQIITKANDPTKRLYTITNNTSPTGTTSMFVAHEKPTRVPEGMVLGMMPDNQPANNMSRSKCFDQSLKFIFNFEKLKNSK
jgi:hypothetical protein